MRVILSERIQKALAGKNTPAGKVIAGCRPEHISVKPAGSNTIKASVDVSEMMGSAVHLHVNADGRDVVVIVQIKDGAVNHDLEMGADIHLTFDGSVMHVFGKDSEMNLEF